MSPTQRPVEVIDNNKSYIFCKSGKPYPFSQLNINFTDKKYNLTRREKEKLSKFCSHYTPTEEDFEESNGRTKLDIYRKIHPENNNLSNLELADLLYLKYYTDMPKACVLSKNSFFYS